MARTWMSHATHMNESCHTHEWVMPHTWMSHVTDTCKWRAGPVPPVGASQKHTQPRRAAAAHRRRHRSLAYAYTSLLQVSFVFTYVSFECMAIPTGCCWSSSLAHISISFIYGVDTCSRLLKIIGLFCKRALWKRRYSAKGTYNFKEPTNRSHPIALFCVWVGSLFAGSLWRLGVGLFCVCVGLFWIYGNPDKLLPVIAVGVSCMWSLLRVSCM